MLPGKDTAAERRDRRFLAGVHVILRHETHIPGLAEDAKTNVLEPDDDRAGSSEAILPADALEFQYPAPQRCLKVDAELVDEVVMRSDSELSVAIHLR